MLTTASSGSPIKPAPADAEHSTAEEGGRIMSRVVVGFVAVIAVALCLLLSFDCLSQTPGSKVNRAEAFATPKASEPAPLVSEPIAFTTLAYRVTIEYDADVGSDGPLPFVEFRGHNTKFLSAPNIFTVLHKPTQYNTSG